MSANDGWMSAGEAARLLKVSRTTLYAYVSRGYVRSQPTPGPSRERLYSRDDVDRLRRQTEARRDPDKAAARSLQWGLPVLESSITFIDGKALYYRGHDAVQLSRSRSVAEVASLIWSGQFDGAFSPTPPRIATTYRPDKTLPFVPRAQAVLACPVGPRSRSLRSARDERHACGLEDSASPDPCRQAVPHFRAHYRSGPGARMGRECPGRGCGAQRAYPVRRPRAERLVVHGSMRRLGRVESVHRRDRRPCGAGRNPAWWRQRARRVDARVTGARASPRRLPSPRACVAGSRSTASGIPCTATAIRARSRFSTCCASAIRSRAS